ncbi:hypothetical protein IQ283_13420 [Alkalihalobacillus hwajinpoensis]|uniref:hypothetical protein n=1 Tax=Guptibacillus hwajinpoensis TaxID=208199 RepID=UPI001883BB1C|nr:hypothetical protein [Pseudalkalibacillus hwajinpoensis]MBF0707591.1 hypothetical protein [Pseudalkalibacillus hwajinpoensis]
MRYLWVVLLAMLVVSCSNSSSGHLPDGILAGTSENWNVQYDFREEKGKELRGITLEYIGDGEKPSTNVTYAFSGETAYDIDWQKTGEVEMNNSTIEIEDTLGCVYPCDELQLDKGIHTVIEWDGQTEKFVLKGNK